LAWYVHVDLIDAGAGRDLAFYQSLLDAAEASASDQLEGDHGPFDTPCCTRIERAVSVATFGTTGDGLDVIDSAADLSALAAIGLPGSRGFLVDSITYCGGPSPSSIGCAQTPACDGNANDDPNLWLVVTMDASDSGLLGGVVAHERGHNACLVHVNVDECQIMRPAAGGACLSAGECANFQAGRTTTGGTCTCHDDASPPAADGATCSGVAGGVCSGAICGDPMSDAGVALLASGGPEGGSGAAADDALALSGATGGWDVLGALGTGGEIVTGLAYARDSSTLYGVVGNPAGDDDLVTIDRATGAITSVVQSYANGSDHFTALAYDPGPTSAPTDDTLWVLESDGTFDDLHTIDPSSPATLTFVGGLAFGAANGFLGMAYDDAHDQLYVSSPFTDGIYAVDLSTCPFFCGLNAIAGLGIPRFGSSLTYSPDTGMLYVVGAQSGVAPLGDRTLYDVVDPVAGTRVEVRGLDAYTAGGLAAFPVPAQSIPVWGVPGVWGAAAPVGAGGALAALGALALRRRKRSR
ncbi:MAG: hypothetical protein KC560_01180, partial [Myxococcales bacterium]|nr:hypothetical protein [Myxococcales bacterium]